CGTCPGRHYGFSRHNVLAGGPASEQWRSMPARTCEAAKSMAHTNPDTPIEILLVEDGDHEAGLTMHALREDRVRNRVTRVEDGVEAMAFLRREGPYAQAPRPDLILLNLCMPRMDGLEVLKEVKSDENLRQIPIVMLTANFNNETVLRAYDLHVNCYVTKPVHADQFLGVVKSIAQFWFSIVKLPSVG